MKSELLSCSAALPVASREMPPAEAAGAVELGRGAVTRFEAASQGLRIRVLEGTLWITQTGDSTDHLIAAGEVFATDHPGRVVAEALSRRARLAWSRNRG